MLVEIHNFEFGQDEEMTLNIATMLDDGWTVLWILSINVGIKIIYTKDS